MSIVRRTGTARVKRSRSARAFLTGTSRFAVDEFHLALRRLYGSRLRDLILYGSWARGAARPDSDIDLAIVLSGRVNAGREIDRLVNIQTDVNLKYNTVISVYPVSRRRYRTVRSPLLLNVRHEGVAL
jgi:predicted nucleotidyltransferase